MTLDQAGQDGVLASDLGFAYRIWRPALPRGDALVLLHGSGTDERTMGPLGAEIAPEAVRIAVRGRVPQEDGWRWFGRITPTSFEQDSIRSEAAAFAAFVETVAAGQGIELGRTVFLGYSNGANLISSIMLLHPGIIRRAVLLRAMPVLDEAPMTDMSQTELLVIAGERDVTYAPFAPALTALLRERGAHAEAHVVAAGHEFGSADAAIVREWLSRTAPAIA